MKIVANVNNNILLIYYKTITKRLLWVETNSSILGKKLNFPFKQTALRKATE